MHTATFQKNKECLVLIPETVTLLRKQMYYEGSKRVKELITYFGEITEYIITGDTVEFNKQEWMLILQAFLDAQENKDYILQADILEGDLFLYLEKLQSHLQAEGHMEIPDYWEANMQSLESVDLFLCQAIIRDSKDEKKQALGVQYEPFLAINGQPTLKVHIGEKVFCMHSTVNPEWEAKELANSWLKERRKEYQIFGIGMGHHVKALLDADETIKVTVLEYRIEPLMMAFTYLDWQKYLLEGRLHFKYESDLIKVLQMMNQEHAEYAFFLHYPSLQCVEEKTLKEMLEDYFIKISSMMEQGKYLIQNFEYLQEQKLPECSKLKELFAEKDVVIVAGGPSVDDELESLKKYRAEISILSVGTVARKLIQIGIRPDAIIVTDPQDVVHRQVKDLNAEDIPLLLLSTAAISVTRHYHGPMYLVYQYGFEPAEQVAKEHGYPLFQTGGSVTTTALDVSIGLGAKRIFLVGADMAYTDNRSHASGVGYEERDFSDFRQVPAVGGGMVYTIRNLDIYRKWIERRLSNLKEPVVYNTSRGAKIAGTVEKKLEDVLSMR